MWHRTTTHWMSANTRKQSNVIVIDNATFHHAQAIEEIVAQAGCEIWYLPLYSPRVWRAEDSVRQHSSDLNKIEHWWFVLKNWMRQRSSEFESFRDCVDVAFNVRPNVLP